MRSLLANRGAIAGLCVLCVVVFAGLFSSLIVPHDPTLRDISRRLSPPLSTINGEFFLLGTDAVGRDILSRIIFGTRITLIVGLASVALAGSVGLTLGLIAGYVGKWPDTIIMRLADIQLALPFMVLAIAVAGALGSSLRNTIIVLGVTGWVTYCRLVRAETLSVREQDYVLSAKAIGAPGYHIVIRHILPNVRASAIVAATLMVARMLIAEASLSFLGLGIPISTPTWGVMISEGREYIVTAWWVAAFPGIAILITVMSVNLVGDWLRDALDPRMRRG
ncbi:MAG: ABC transporter permease [Caldilineaceae bacterium]|nr:ABC transporter permease [Caldilineaceae bacterium]